MHFGICVASKLDEIDYVVRAEELGYTMAWFADSQMIWSDCYAALALAAERTHKIALGTGVSVAGTRIAPVTANSIASIATLAPGRTFLGIGTGNTAMRLMGHKPLRLAQFDHYLGVVRGLLDGERVDFTWRGRETSIQLQMRDLGFLEFGHRIPMYVSAFAPKALGLVGKHGDGLVGAYTPRPASLAGSLNHVRRGAEAAGRALSDDFLCSLLAGLAILGPGESLEDQSVLDQCGAFAVASIHYAYEMVHQFGADPPRTLGDSWHRYVELVEAVPEAVRHERIHAGHCTYLLDEERALVTPELIRATCLAGRPEEIVEQVAAARDAGVGHIMLMPSLTGQTAAIERFAKEVMPLL